MTAPRPLDPAALDRLADEARARINRYRAELAVPHRITNDLGMAAHHVARELDEAVNTLRAIAARDRATCDWEADRYDGGLWGSACGEAWVFNDGGPVENGCIYCHHCGKRVVVVPRSEEPTDDE